MLAPRDALRGPICDLESTMKKLLGLLTLLGFCFAARAQSFDHSHAALTSWSMAARLRR
jgi:hypothetical protein